MDLKEINRLIMIGVVTAVYPEHATARVVFPDRDDLPSSELQILYTRALGCEVYAMPEIGEEVVCIFLPNGIEEGYILGGYYNTINTPPSNDRDTYMIKFPDGNSVTYKNGTFQFIGNLKVSGSVTASIFNGNVNGTCSGAHS